MIRITTLGLMAAMAMSWYAGLSVFGGELAVEDAAPAFDLPGSDGKTYKLSDLKGKKVVVVAWFPKAFTGG